MYRTDFWTLWEKARVGWSERTASKHVYYQEWNRSPAQVGCMRQVLGAGALGRPRGMEWGGRWEGGSGWGTHVNPWLIHVNVWQKPLQYCKVISLQLIKIIGWGGRSKQVTVYSLMYSFPSFEPVHYSMCNSNCCFLTCIQVSQEAGKVICYSHLLKNFPQFVVIHTVKVLVEQMKEK